MSACLDVEGGITLNRHTRGLNHFHSPARRHHPNVLFLFYEDMKEDFLRELGRLNSFLETGLTESQLQAVAHHASYSGMKSRGATNPTAALQEAGNFKKGEADFIRKGERRSRSFPVSADQLSLIDNFTVEMTKKCLENVKNSVSEKGFILVPTTSVEKISASSKRNVCLPFLL